MVSVVLLLVPSRTLKKLNVNFSHRYIQESFWNCYGPEAWIRWMTGRPCPGGQKYKSQGYHMYEVGPTEMDGKGMNAYEETRQKLFTQGRGACPFRFS